MEHIDGHPVVSHRVRFQKRTEITERQADMVKDGDTVVWLVKATCLPPQYHAIGKEAEDRYRFNIQDVTDAMPLSGDLREQAIAYMDHGLDQSYFSVLHGLEPRLPFESGFGVSAQAIVDELLELLDEIGELHEGEALSGAVRRLLERRIIINNSPMTYANSGGE